MYTNRSNTTPVSVHSIHTRKHTARRRPYYVAIMIATSLISFVTTTLPWCVMVRPQMWLVILSAFAGTFAIAYLFTSKEEADWTHLDMICGSAAFISVMFDILFFVAMVCGY